MSKIEKVLKSLKEKEVTHFLTKDTLLLKTVNSGRRFEENVENSFINLGFKEEKLANLELVKNNKDDIINKFDELDIEIPDEYNMKFISQPFGSQSFPDIIAFENNKMYIIEIKYTATPKAKAITMWNASLPKTGVIYLACRKNDTPTYFMGEDILSKKEHSILTSFAESLRQVAKLAEPGTKSKSGFFLWYRAAFQLKLPKNDNHFSEDIKKKREKNVIKFVNKK